MVYEAIHGPDPRSRGRIRSGLSGSLPGGRSRLSTTVAQNLPLIQQERDREAAKAPSAGSGRASARMRVLLDLTDGGIADGDSANWNRPAVPIPDQIHVLNHWRMSADQAC